MQKLLALSEKLSKYLIAATLIIVPLLPKFPLIRVPGTYVAIRFEDILLLVLALSLLPKIVLEFKKIVRDPIISAFLIFFAVGFVSLLAGYFVTQTVQLHIGILHWARRIEYIIPFFAAYLLLTKENISESIKFYVKILVIVVLIALVYGVGERYFRFPVIITQNDEYSKGIALFWTPGSHINATFAGHYDLSAFLVMVMPIFLSVLFVIKNKLVKLATIIASSAGLWLLINSVSRMAQVSYLISISVALLFLKKFKGWFVVVLISVIFMTMSSGLDARFGRAFKVIYERITTGKSFGYVQKHFVAVADEVTISKEIEVETPVPVATPAPAINDVSISIRVNVEWPRAIRSFLKNPILGTGYSSMNLATDNDYLRMLGETGILGLIAFFLIFFRIGKVLIKAFPLIEKLSGVDMAFMAGIFGGLVGTFASAFLLDLFEASKFAIIFWLLLGCAVKLIKSKEYAK